MARSWLMVLYEPWSAPAIRLMVSSIKVPPRSLAPPCSTSRHRSSPSLTQEHWIESIAPCSSSRDTACTARFSRSEEHTSELQSRPHLVCRLLLEKKKTSGPGLLDRTAHLHAPLLLFWGGMDNHFPPDLFFFF